MPHGQLLMGKLLQNSRTIDHYIGAKYRYRCACTALEQIWNNLEQFGVHSQTGLFIVIPKTQAYKTQLCITVSEYCSSCMCVSSIYILLAHVHECGLLIVIRVMNRLDNFQGEQFILEMTVWLAISILTQSAPW